MGGDPNYLRYLGAQGWWLATKAPIQPHHLRFGMPGPRTPKKYTKKNTTPQKVHLDV